MSYKELFELNIAIINFGGYIKYFIKRLRSISLGKTVKRNSTLLNTPKNKVCYICALGPSLKQVDLSKIKGDSIVVNRFYKMASSCPGFTPTFYLMIDSAFAGNEIKEDTIGAIDAYIGRGTKYLLNPLCQTCDFIGNYPADQLFYISTCKGLFYSHKKLKLDSIMPAFGNVACTAIGIAMAMGYKEIVLLGCDFNSFAQTTQSHCYIDNVSTRQIRLDFELFNYSFDANMHTQLADYAKRNNIKIINSTKGSLIDAYPVVIDENLYKHD